MEAMISIEYIQHILLQILFPFPEQHILLLHSTGVLWSMLKCGQCFETACGYVT